MARLKFGTGLKATRVPRNKGDKTVREWVWSRATGRAVFVLLGEERRPPPAPSVGSLLHAAAVLCGPRCIWRLPAVALAVHGDLIHVVPAVCGDYLLALVVCSLRYPCFQLCCPSRVWLLLYVAFTLCSFWNVVRSLFCSYCMWRLPYVAPVIYCSYRMWLLVCVAPILCGFAMLLACHVWLLLNWDSFERESLKFILALNSLRSGWMSSLSLKI